MFIIVAFGNFFQIFKKILLKFAEVAPVGAWIEINHLIQSLEGKESKSPLLGRGLKSQNINDGLMDYYEVAPVGAWIEIICGRWCRKS